MDIREQIRKEVEERVKVARADIDMAATSALEAVKVHGNELAAIIEKYQQIANSMPLNILEAIQNGAVMDIKTVSGDATFWDRGQAVQLEARATNGGPDCGRITLVKGSWRILLLGWDGQGFSRGLYSYQTGRRARKCKRQPQNISKQGTGY